MISYRTQRVLRQLGTALLVLLAAGAVLMLCWFLWLQRYVVYTDSGARLDFSVSPQIPQGEPALPREENNSTIDFVYNDGSAGDTPVTKELERFSGYYVTMDQLAGDLTDVTQQLKDLPNGSTIMLELKSITGEFYYNSSLGRHASGVDTQKVNELIALLRSKSHYLIAMVPAFRERYYFLDDEAGRVRYGLAKKGGNGSLWQDAQKCYWFDPQSDGTRTYLVQLANELQVLGFQEIVFSHFQYPSTSEVTMPADRLTALNETAAMLVGTCASETFAVSFLREAVDLTVPESRSRLYIQYATAEEVAGFAAQMSFADPAPRLVFLTDLNDTRYDTCCVLRPLEMAH